MWAVSMRPVLGAEFAGDVCRSWRHEELASTKIERAIRQPCEPRIRVQQCVRNRYSWLRLGQILHGGNTRRLLGTERKFERFLAIFTLDRKVVQRRDD